MFLYVLVYVYGGLVVLNVFVEVVYVVGFFVLLDVVYNYFGL